MTYHALNTLLQGRNAQQRKLTHNTYAIRHATNFTIRYHSTDILTFHPDGRVVFNTGGWRTSTTKQRLNRFGPQGVSIYQRDFEWFIAADGQTEEFFDGLTLTCPTFIPLTIA